MYPALDKKGVGEYVGKLRLNYELKPIAFLLEQAGGIAMSGTENILDIEPQSLHQRTGFVAGNREIMEEYMNQKSTI